MLTLLSTVQFALIVVMVIYLAINAPLLERSEPEDGPLLPIHWFRFVSRRATSSGISKRVSALY